MALLRLSVRARLGLGFGLVLSLLLAVVATSYAQLASFNQNVEALATTRLVQLITVGQASNTLGQISRSTRNVLVLDEEKEAKEELAMIRQYQGAIEELLSKVGAQVVTEREKKLFANIVDARAAYIPHEAEFLKLSEQGDFSSAKDLLLKSMRPEQLRLIEAMEHFQDYQVSLSADEARKASEAFVLTRTVVFSLTGAALLLGLLLAWRITVSITRPIAEAVSAARQVAAGDLSVQVRRGGRDETGQLLESLAVMAHSLRELVGEVAGGARMVADTSAQIAQGNQDLSQRTEEQAGTLEETASSMEELTATVTQNAGNARNATELAGNASDVARKGGKVVGEVVTTMEEISGASRRISEIIGVIDGIAFQTNILALNAAVEAARAGDQGRGFAVVASEVRNLAQRSAAAAKEIKTLIGDSVGKVEAGTRLVANAGQTMEEIVASVKQVSDLISEIAAASEEQSTGIEQVNRAVSQMDHVVQQNASLVEEAAAATESMKGQAASLLQTVARFRLEQDVERRAQEPASAEPASSPVLPIAPIRVRQPALPAAGPRPQAPAADTGEWKQF
jgi:methyl-accepting chemotaxis protein